MKGFSAIALILCLLTVATSFADDGRIVQVLQSYLETDTSVKPNTDAFSTFLYQLEKKESSFKHEKDFLRHVFLKTHQKFLKNYSAYASFGELLEKGKYNCLTGTALYAILLDHFQIEYSVIETNYHIFILAKADGETILLETTDPLNGFVYKQEDIDERLTSYRNNALQRTDVTKGVRYEFSFNLWEGVSLTELKGLLYFNHAVEAYNQQKLEASVSLLILAGKYRPSERIQEFSSVVMLTIANSDLDLQTKEKLILQLREVRKQSASMMTASVGR